MTPKEYTFKSGFTIKLRSTPTDTFFAMGETHIIEAKVFDLYQGKTHIGTYDTFEEAKQVGEGINVQ